MTFIQVPVQEPRFFHGRPAFSECIFRHTPDPSKKTLSIFSVSFYNNRDTTRQSASGYTGPDAAGRFFRSGIISEQLKNRLR